jgi:hypothetical protein
MPVFERSIGRRCARAVAVLTVALGIVSSVPAGAQDVTEPSLKAAFVYNFTRFTEWPVEALPPGAPLVACVITDNAIASALERMVQGRPVMGRPVTVVRSTREAPPRGCHLLFASGLSAAQLTPLMAGVRGMPVLTIIDSDGLARVPGIARLFVDSGNLRFDIDHGMAKREGLKLSSKLLTLAKKVYDDRSGVTP